MAYLNGNHDLLMTVNQEAPEDLEPSGRLSAPDPTKAPSHRRSFTSLPRELSGKEFLSPAVVKLLYDDIERLERDNVELSGFKNRFHETDKRVAVLEQKLQMNLGSEIISIACLTVGAAALGYAPNLWASQPAGAIVLGFGVVLLGAGLYAKKVQS